MTDIAGMARAATIPMMTTTTMSSMSEKPAARRLERVEGRNVDDRAESTRIGDAYETLRH